MSNHTPLLLANPRTSTTFKPGAEWNGNANGRPPLPKPISAAMRQRLEEQHPELALSLADAILDKGKTGDVFALREIMDRVEGKVPAPIDITSKSINVQIAASYSELALGARESLMAAMTGGDTGEIRELPAQCPQNAQNLQDSPPVDNNGHTGG